MNEPVSPDWARHSETEALSTAQLAMLDALMNRLMPGDPARGVPSASEAGAARFVSRLLGREPVVYYEVPAWRALYPEALAALDAVAMAIGGTGLAEATPEVIDTLLQDLQASRLTGVAATFNQALVFKTLLRHCYQGCFSDPRWGGNRDAEMWRAIGYPLRPAAS